MAVLHDDDTCSGRELDRDRALAIPRCLPLAQHLAAVHGRYGRGASRHVGGAIFVLVAVAANVGEAHAVIIHVGGPEVVEHVLEAVQIGDALHKAARGGTLDNGTYLCVLDPKDTGYCSSGALFEGIFVFGFAGLRRRLLGLRIVAVLLRLVLRDLLGWFWLGLL